MYFLGRCIFLLGSIFGEIFHKGLLFHPPRPITIMGMVLSVNAGMETECIVDATVNSSVDLGDSVHT